MRRLSLFLLLAACTEEQGVSVDQGPLADAVPPGRTAVVLNEVSATDDYIELFNPGETLSLTGWAVVDRGYDPGDASTHLAHRLVLGGELVFGDRRLIPELPFGIGTADGVTLLDPEGRAVDRVEWAAGTANPARCRLPDGTGPFAPCAPTPGEPNSALPAPSMAGIPLVVNELSSTEDRIELLNLGDQPIDLAGLFIADDGSLAHQVDHYRLSGMLVAGGRLDLIDEAAEPILGLGREDGLWLLDAEGAVIDSTTWLDGAAFVSWCRIPDGTGPFQPCSMASFGEANPEILTMIFAWWKRRRRRALLATPLPAPWIGHLEKNFALWAWLDDDERKRLLDITRVLVAEKDWEGGAGLEVTEEMKVTIAAQAALLLLNIKHDYYNNLQTIVVYPASYKLPRSQRDSPYLAQEHVPVLGHARMNGGVVLSWRSALSGGRNATDGHNLIYHELAHKLDMKDGVIDGTPFLPSRLTGARWFKVMTKEYTRLKRQAASGRQSVLDFYGATDVAEFFAVATESFFEEPLALEEKHPELYGVLKDLYHQDPAARLARRRRVG